MSAQTGIRVRITGRVQGVGFRYFTHHRATSYGLRGYVRNLADGGVEVVAVGPPAVLAQLVGDLERGAPASRVKECRVTWEQIPERFARFSIDP